MALGAPVPAAGVPDSTRADELNDTPEGSPPDSVTAGTGSPAAVTVKVPLFPTENVDASAEVMTGPSLIVRVKSWVAGVPTPLLAVKVTG